MDEKTALADVEQYEEKIRRLQDNVSSLRLSRRILMSLLEQLQLCQREETEQLIKENRRLKKQANIYATRLWEKNRQIIELEKQTRN